MWEVKHQDAIHEGKENRLRAPFLFSLDLTRHFSVVYDASGSSVSRAILQKDVDGHARRISFETQHFASAEKIVIPFMKKSFFS